MNKYTLFLTLFFLKAHTDNILLQDAKTFYSKKTCIQLFKSFAPAALMANTQVDQDLFDFYKKNIRSPTTDTFSNTFKPFGSKKPLFTTLAITVAGSTLLHLKSSNFLHQFSKNSIRAIIVGIPPLVAGQNFIGADRPAHHTNSYWRPFKNDHALSGHAFLGAVPFITAANLTRNIPLKALLLITSTFTGLSRINDESHYPSQVLLGWALAYASCDAINRSNLRINLTQNSITIGTIF